MKCPNCGKEIPNDSIFCEACGKQVWQKDMYSGLLSNRSSLFLFVSIFLISAMFVFGAQYFYLLWQVMACACILVGGYCVWSIAKRKIKRSLGVVCAVLIVIIIGNLVFWSDVFGWSYTYAHIYIMANRCRLYYLPIIICILSFVLCAIPIIVPNKQKTKSADYTIQPKRGELIPTQWVFVLVSFFVLVVNLLLTLDAHRTDKVEGFLNYGWFFIMLSCLVLGATVILSVNNKIRMLNVLFMGLIFAFNCAIWETNAFADITKTDAAQVSIDILKNKEKIAVISTGHYSTGYQDDEMRLKQIVNSTGGEYAVGEVNITYHQYYGDENFVPTATMIAIAMLTLLLYVFYVVYETKKRMVN